MWFYNDIVLYWGGYGICFDGGGVFLGNFNYNIYNNIIFNISSSSIGVWGILEIGENYDNSLINVENNIVDGIIFFVEVNKFYVGIKLFNNISCELKIVGY